MTNWNKQSTSIPSVAIITPSGVEQRGISISA